MAGRGNCHDTLYVNSGGTVRGGSFALGKSIAAYLLELKNTA